MLQVFQVLRNKYFIASAAFLVWMIFFDRNDIPTQVDYQQKLNGLRMEKAFYLEETAEVTSDLEDLNSEASRIQKFARERYLMKKDNEDVFVIVQQEPDDKP